MPSKAKVEVLPSFDSFVSLIVDAAPYIGAVAVIVSLVLYLTQKSGARRDIVRFTIDKESGEKKTSPRRRGFFNGVNAFFIDLESAGNKSNIHKVHRIRTELKGKSHVEVVKLLLSIDSFKDTRKKKSNTIVGMMLEEKFASSHKNCRILSITLIGYLLLVYFELLTFNLFAILIPSFLIAALFLDEFLITLRIRRGWYGRNEYEAREIINYVTSHANKDDFNDDGGLKKLMDAPELIDTKNETLVGGART